MAVDSMNDFKTNKAQKALEKKRKQFSYTWDSEDFFCKECLTCIHTLSNEHKNNVYRILNGNFVWFHQVQLETRQT